MAERAIRLWTTLQSHDCPALAPLISTIYFLDINLRKVLLTTCRIQPPLVTSSCRLYQRYASEWDSMISFPCNNLSEEGSHRISLRSFVNTSIGFFSDPTLAGLISMLIRFLPYASYDSVAIVRDATLKKELQAATSIYHPTTYSYQNLFGPPILRNTTLNGGAGGNAQLNASIRGCLHRAALRIPTQYPKTSLKTVMVSPYHASYEPFSKVLRRPRSIRTTRDIEEVYYRSGWKLDGVTEMRSAWKGNDLKPRVYYARGGSQHFASSIIQGIFNALVDSLPNTNRRNRFNLYDLDMMTPDMTLMIYDYSSFTSTLHEIRNFTSKLAEFLRGTTITVIDSHTGPCERDLGDILDEYNQICNMSAEFDASELLGITDAILEHNCGMLGVPGNISSCTLLHGIHLALILDSLSRGKVIGDDAIGIYVDDKDLDRENMCDALQAIGRLELSKMEFWRDADEEDGTRWNYEKRPFGRVHERVHKGRLVTWPSINITLGIKNPFHRDLGYSRSKEFQISCRQWSRFQMHLLDDITEETQDVILHYYKRFWKHWELPKNKKERGHVGWWEIDGDRIYIILPPCSKEMFSTRMIDFLMVHFGSVVLVPAPITLKSWGTTIGSQFHGRMTPMLSYLESMDVISSKKIVEEKLIEDCSHELLESLMLGKLPPTYEFSVCDYVPDWSVPSFNQYMDTDPSELDLNV